MNSFHKNNLEDLARKIKDALLLRNESYENTDQKKIKQLTTYFEEIDCLHKIQVIELLQIKNILNLVDYPDKYKSLTDLLKRNDLSSNYKLYLIKQSLNSDGE